ncbi:MAG: hypothetical protein Q9217_000103 [Psora testacea]
MADEDRKAHAEKLAAAKKRFEQLRKQKGKGNKAEAGKQEEDHEVSREKVAHNKDDHEAQPEPDTTNSGQQEEKKNALPEMKDENELEKQAEDSPLAPAKPLHNRQPSLSVQSKMRSSSFRRSSLSQTPLSPDANGTKSPDLPVFSPNGESVPSMYRKQAARLEELEKENRRLGIELQDAERKWKRTDEELEELRGASGEVAELKSRAQRLDAQLEELNKVKQENTALQRQNSQLQSQISKRHASSPSHANASSPLSSLQSQLDSKSSTIESMEMEISNLRSQLEKISISSSSHSEQVAALEDKLDRAERAAGAAQRELIDVKKSLERASEKAVREGTEKTSAETKIRTLSREAEESRRSAEESLKRIDTLEKKLIALTNMHKDAETRRQAGERERERLEKEASDMRRRLAGLENENLRLRDERERARKRDVSGADDEGIDELEDDERRRMERKVRDLEGEVYELRRGVWKERRKTLQGSIDGEDGMTSPSTKFDEIDLSGPSLSYRRQSLAGAQQSLSFSNVLSGISAFTGGGGRRGSDELLENFDDGGFDEDAFRQAQEEEARKRVERVKAIKRGLKEWEGWRMDLVELRRAGGVGVANIFDV